MKNRMIFLLLAAVLVCCMSCSPSDASEPHEDPDAPTDQGDTYLSYRTGPMDFDDWQSVYGTQIELPDLYATDDPAERKKGLYPRFLGEVVSAEDDYLVVKPRADITRTVQTPQSYASALLEHAQSYIIPRALMMDHDYVKANEVAVGDLVQVQFNSLQVYKDTKYGESPVLRIVFYFDVLSENDVVAAE